MHLYFFSIIYLHFLSAFADSCWLNYIEDHFPDSLI